MPRAPRSASGPSRPTRTTTGPCSPWRPTSPSALHPTLLPTWPDRGLAGDEPRAFPNGRGITVGIVGTRERRGSQVEPRRWKAEQTFGCLLRCRRLRVDDEMSCGSSRGMAMLVALSMTGMRLERLIGS
jgi:transposase